MRHGMRPFVYASENDVLNFVFDVNGSLAFVESYRWRLIMRGEATIGLEGGDEEAPAGARRKEEEAAAAVGCAEEEVGLLGVR